MAINAFQWSPLKNDNVAHNESHIIWGILFESNCLFAEHIVFIETLFNTARPTEIASKKPITRQTMPTVIIE